MKIHSILKAIKSRNAKKRNSIVFQNSKHLFLKEELNSNQLVDLGYMVIPLLDETKLHLIEKQLDLFLEKMEKPIISEFYTSGRDTPDIRNEAKNLTWPIIEPEIIRNINTIYFDIDGCTFLLKPPGENSGLSPHQDSSLIDETQYSAYYGWVALQDTTIENGCINLLPGSHKWGNHFRSLNVEWVFDPFVKLLSQLSIPIQMKAGELLLFDSALIHGSYPNQTNELRSALNLFVKPKKAKITHYACFEDTPKNLIESYSVDIDFFITQDYRIRPNSAVYPFIDYCQKVNLKLNERKIRKWSRIN
jgi:hypothetical protein